MFGYPGMPVYGVPSYGSRPVMYFDSPFVGAVPMNSPFMPTGVPVVHRTVNVYGSGKTGTEVYVGGNRVSSNTQPISQPTNQKYQIKKERCAAWPSVWKVTWSDGSVTYE